MKRILALLLVCFCMTACTNKKGQDYLNGKVLEIKDTEILVECIDESSNQLTGTPVSVSKEVISADGIPQIEVGDTVRVVYDFAKVEKLSDPVKISQVYAIYLLDEQGNVIPN